MQDTEHLAHLHQPRPQLTAVGDRQADEVVERFRWRLGQPFYHACRGQPGNLQSDAVRVYENTADPALDVARHRLQEVGQRLVDAAAVSGVEHDGVAALLEGKQSGVRQAATRLDVLGDALSEAGERRR